MSGTVDDDGTGDLRDEALRRALQHAPDHAATPNWRMRKAILDHAREAVAPFTAPVLPEPTRPAWQRLLGIGAGRMPWNAAFATLLVGVFAALLWQREPVPGARPDSEPQVDRPAQRGDATQPQAPSPPGAIAPPVAAPPAPLPPRRAPERALPSSQDIVSGPVPSLEPPAAAPDAAPPSKNVLPPRAVDRPAPSATPSEPARRRADEAAQSPSAAAAARESRRKEAGATGGEPVPPAPAAAAPAGAAPRDSVSERMRSEEEAASRQRLPAAPGLAPGAGASRESAEPGRAAASPAPAASPPGPSFSALSQWSRITITQRGGASRSLSRSEAQDLNALLGSAALSASGAQPMSGTPEWRVTLERSNGEVMATFELGPSQVRWREGRGAAATGTPSAASLAALRAALHHAVEPQEQPSAPPQFRLKRAPAEPETEPPAEPTR